MILCLDLGNTRAKIAVFDPKNSEQLAFFEKKTLSLLFLTELFEKHTIQTSILCSVVAYSDEIVAFLAKNSHFILLSSQTDLPIRIKYATPQTLGRDRLAAICGAWSLFPQQNCLVIDAGTCVKYDFVTAEGDYLGGSISPGIGLRFRAMHEFTAKLPLIQREKIHHFIGDSTETALRTGGQLGAAMEAQGFANLYKKEFGSDLRLIVTGGDGTYLMPYLEGAIYLPYLVLLGLFSVANRA